MWTQKTKEYVDSLEVGHELFISLPGLTCTLVVRFVDSKTREVALVCPEEHEERSYFATVEQHITYDNKKRKERKKKEKNEKEIVKQKVAADEIEDKDEVCLTDNFQKSFIAVRI